MFLTYDIFHFVLEQRRCEKIGDLPDSPGGFGGLGTTRNRGKVGTCLLQLLCSELCQLYSIGNSGNHRIFKRLVLICDVLATQTVGDMG